MSNSRSLMVLFILLGFVALPFLVSPSNAVPKVYVYPKVVSGEPLETISVSIRISAAHDVFAWEFMLSWNASILDFVKVEEGDFLKGIEMQQTFLVSKTYQDEVELDSFSAGCTRMGYVSGVDGDGTLATVSFTVQTKGATPLDLYDTKLRSGGLNPIEHNVEDALFTTGIPRASFTFSPPIARINQTVEFDATESTDDGSIVSYNWDFGDGEVASETDPLTSHAYGEGGTYIVLLTVTDNDLLNGTAMRDVKVRYPHDIMVTAVSASPHHVIAGETVTITVTVMNDGTEAESSLNVKVKYDDSEIGSPQSVSNLAAGENKTLTFSWNTAGVPKDTYRIKAEASLVPGELDELDNLKLGNTVEVKEPAPFPWTTVVGGSFLVAVFGICVFFLMKRRGKAPAPL